MSTMKCLADVIYINGPSHTADSALGATYMSTSLCLTILISSETWNDLWVVISHS